MIPVDPVTLLAFTATAAAIVLTPGPDTALILRHALNGGRGPGLAAVAGVQMGLLGHLTLAATGVTVLIASSPMLFRAIALIGAAYLGWIGIQALRGGGALKIERGKNATSPLRAAREAMLCNLLNPKVVMLFIGLLPNFINTQAEGGVLIQLVVLTAVLIVLNTAWQAPMAFAADTLRRWLSNARTQRIVSASTGAVMIGFAGLMIWENLLS